MNEEGLVDYIQLVSEVKTTNVAGLTLDFARRLEVFRQVCGRDHVTPFGGQLQRSLLELEA
jgi:hypothetical protein